MMPVAAGLSDLALLRLLHLVSPALPIGAFAWSQGLEYAIDSGHLKSGTDIQNWLHGVLHHNLAYLDAPMLCRLHDAARAGDSVRLAYWNGYVLASRETRELYEEDTQLGRALYRLLAQAGQPGQLDPTAPVSLLSAFAEAAVQAQVPCHACVMGWLWTWLENQIAVACKTLPLGQSAAQQVLRALLPALADVAGAAQRLPDDALGASFPGFAIISTKHETQYSRLFRS